MTDAPTSPLAALHLLVSMLGEGEIAAPGASFYDRLAEAVCRLGAMRRAAVYLSDDARRRVWAAGAHGIAVDRLAAAGPVADVPAVALRALEQDAVIEVTADRLGDELPSAEVARLGLTDITCIPMSAGGRHYGVVLAERGRDRDASPLSDAERDGLWTLGKVCALAASARAATRQQERARHLGDRLDLARDVHERVIQRLFGVTLALGAPGDLTPPQRERCADELQAATEELRLTIQRPLAQLHRGDAAAADAPALRDEVRRLAAEHAEIEFIINWPDDLEVPAVLDPLAQTVVAEAVRNARKHARPRAIAITVASEQDGGALAIDVANDGVGPGAPAGAGVGLRLAAFEALEFGAAVDFGRLAPDRWHVRLVLPLPATATTTNGAAA
jgi:signal transduction histidine kinase